jgi:hypothetical protein
MKKFLIVAAVAAIAAFGAAACTPPTGGEGGSGAFVAGCYDSTTSSDSLIYDGHPGTYKNAQFAINNGSCASDPVNDYVTVVIAGNEASALAACQAGPDEAADVAARLSSLGFTSVPSNVWFCTNPLSGRLLQVGDCYAIGSVSVEYLGPRDTLNNVALHGASTTCAASPPPAPAWTYVQRSTQPAALTACAAVVGAAFTHADTLAVLFPAMPNDTYLCS